MKLEMNRIALHAHFIQLLSSARTQAERRKILKTANKAQLLFLREICNNVCAGSLKLSKTVKARLKRYAPVIRKLGDKRVKNCRVKEELLQSGGFLPLLAPAILGLLSTIGGRAISKAIGV